METYNKLKEYFTKSMEDHYCGIDCLLEILDPEYAGDVSKDRRGYTGVTLDYLKTYVIKKQILNEQLLYILGILKNEKIIKIIYCGDIGNLVVEKYNCPHGLDTEKGQFNHELIAIQKYINNNV